MRMYLCKTLHLKTTDPDLCSKNRKADRPGCAGCHSYLEPADDEAPAATPPKPAPACPRCGRRSPAVEERGLCGTCLAEIKTSVAKAKKATSVRDKVPAQIPAKDGQKSCQIKGYDDDKPLKGKEDSVPKTGTKTEPKAETTTPVDCCRRCGRSDVALNGRGWCTPCWSEAHRRKPVEKKPVARRIYVPGEEKTVEDPFEEQIFGPKPKDRATLELGAEPGKLRLLFEFDERDAQLLKHLLDEVERHPVHIRIAGSLIGAVVARARRL